MSEAEVSKIEYQCIMAFYENDFQKIDTFLSQQLLATLQKVTDLTQKA